jgi:hypothetical protein
MAKKKKSPRRKKLESFVLDGSTALAWCFTNQNSAYADAVARKLPSLGALVPTIWHLEVANAMVVGERRGRCDRGDTLKWTGFLSSLSISVDEHSGGRVFNEVVDLARAQDLSTRRTWSWRFDAGFRSRRSTTRSRKRLWQSALDFSIPRRRLRCQ